MPIKFRCLHCDHLLGISRKKAGEQVDCPACGRAIRVPDLDGNTRPVEEGQLRVHDPKLLDAFKELDEIDKAPQQLTMEPRIRVNKLVLDPLPGNVVKELGVIPVKQVIKEEDSDEIDVLEELKPILETPTAKKETRRNRTKSNTQSNWYVITFLLMLISFVGGYFVGMKFPYQQQAKAVADNQGEKQTAKEPVTAPGTFTIKGKISYKLPSGEERPDRGARIFLLPQKYSGKEKLPATGFRAGDTLGDFTTAKLALEKLGGYATLVKDDGRYELTTPTAGEYSLVIVSRFSERADKEIVGALVLPIMLAFFEKPHEVLGKVGCHADTLSLNTKANIDWGYVFAP